jgi:predicted ATPase
MTSFKVLPHGASATGPFTDQVHLVEDNWNDWFKYQTQYYLTYFDASGTAHDVGSVKIAELNWSTERTRPSIPQSFEQLSEAFFSLGQEDGYYQALTSLGEDVRDSILKALRDIASDPAVFSRAMHEEVTTQSLMRNVPRVTIEGQFRRLAHGGARLTNFNFTYSTPSRTSGQPRTLIACDVEPESEPPTNIHVLIGSNGVGKTTLLQNMAYALVGARAHQDVPAGSFSAQVDGVQTAAAPFANLVSVSFSAFDLFEPISQPSNLINEIRYTYVGLRQVATTGVETPRAPKDPNQLADEFADAVTACLQGARRLRWLSALRTLESDPIFGAAGIADLAEADRGGEVKGEARSVFARLSSGHKIVLLITTRLVENVDERSLVLLDEPEAHLHPPLLSAFVRAISDLLVNRNGVALVATHSPVVLQEVPESCVWRLRRFGDFMTVERPTVETFGENIGVLTSEIFGLEVTHSGYHQILATLVGEGLTYEQVLRRFRGQLGGEAKATLRALVAARDAAGA